MEPTKEISNPDLIDSIFYHQNPRVKPILKQLIKKCSRFKSKNPLMDAIEDLESMLVNRERLHLHVVNEFDPIPGFRISLRGCDHYELCSRYESTNGRKLHDHQISYNLFDHLKYITDIVANKLTINRELIYEYLKIISIQHKLSKEDKDNLRLIEKYLANTEFNFLQNTLMFPTLIET